MHNRQRIFVRIGYIDHIPFTDQDLIVLDFEDETQGTDFLFAKVVKSFRSIAVNDFILPYQRRSPKIPITESVPGLIGSIIVSEEQSEIIGDLTLAFIDKGKTNDVRNGQVYSIFYQEKEEVDATGKKSVILTPVDFGKLIVLHTEEETATVLVTQLDQSATPGTLIRTPATE